MQSERSWEISYEAWKYLNALKDGGMESSGGSLAVTKAY